MEYQRPYRYEEPHLSKVLGTIIASPEFVHVIVIRHKDTAKLLSHLFPDRNVQIVRTRQDMMKALETMKANETGLVCGSESILCTGWTPPYPDVTTISATYDLGPSHAIQLWGRIRNADTQRYLIWKRRNRRNDRLSKTKDAFAEMWAQIRMSFEGLYRG